MNLPKKIEFNSVRREFTRVQYELIELGLIRDGKYLHNIELYQTHVPSLFGTLGFIFDSGTTWIDRFLGFKDGAIYIPSHASLENYTPGETLADTIRHEFGHAWYWFDPGIFRRSAFRQTFKGSYNGDWKRIGKGYFVGENFVSEYAMTSPAEDFAETFMMYVKYRNSLERFQKFPEIYKKMKFIKEMVKEARSRV